MPTYKKVRSKTHKRKGRKRVWKVKRVEVRRKSTSRAKG